MAFVGEETATTGMWAHRAALIRWGLMPCATTACVRRSVLQLCLAFEDGFLCVYFNFWIVKGGTMKVGFS